MAQWVDYLHSPVHQAVLVGDHKALIKLLSALPKLSDPSLVQTEHHSITQEQLADQISSVVDRRDVPHRETPLHLAVRLNDVTSARALLLAGADVSLQNASGWNPLQEALCRGAPELGLTLARFHHLSAWCKWRRRLPRLVQVLRRMRDFYMEISFHFESSIVPFLGKVAPCDTYRIWKRDGNVRADTSLAGFDGMKIQRLHQSFLFLGEGSGCLLVLNREQRKIWNAFEPNPTRVWEVDHEFLRQSSVYRPGMDVTKAQLVGRTNWRRQPKIESVGLGGWKSKVFDLHNVTVSFRSRKVPSPGEFEFELELDEEAEQGFIVAQNPRYSISSDRRRHSSFVREETDFIAIGRKSLSLDVKVKPPLPLELELEKQKRKVVAHAHLKEQKEKEYVKCLRPSVWLTQEFPLKTEELLPLLDILANKVKAVRRLRELLTTKFPSGSFPVKVAIPVVPTVKVVITFTKFMELQPPSECFYTPLSSPGIGDEDEDENCPPPHKQHLGNQEDDPFAIPSDYEWASFDDKMPKMNKSSSIRKAKGKGKPNK